MWHIKMIAIHLCIQSGIIIFHSKGECTGCTHFIPHKSRLVLVDKMLSLSIDLILGLVV